MNSNSITSMILIEDKEKKTEQIQHTYTISFLQEQKKVSFGSEERKKKKILGEFNFGAYCYISSSNLCISNLL